MGRVSLASAKLLKLSQLCWNGSRTCRVPNASAASPQRGRGVVRPNQVLVSASIQILTLQLSYPSRKKEKIAIHLGDQTNKLTMDQRANQCGAICQNTLLLLHSYGWRSQNSHLPSYQKRHTWPQWLTMMAYAPWYKYILKRRHMKKHMELKRQAIKLKILRKTSNSQFSLCNLLQIL